MFCQEYEQLISDYWTDTLPSEEVQILKQHLLQCPKCNKLFLSLKSLDQQVSSLPVPVLSNEHAERLFTKYPLFSQRCPELRDNVRIKNQRFSRKLIFFEVFATGVLLLVLYACLGRG